ncbi:hypothetical protein FRC16_007914 [Serendipita sp. 398]|nr:hypothetical protein FRC16_007914 [Serendipita sp. 398]
MSSSLQGKIAIVTGSSRGIGSAIAVSLAQKGASVVINYVSSNSKSRAEEVAKTVETFGSKSLVVQADLAKLEDLDKLVKQTVATFGKIDILVNNGGVGEFAPIGSITPESYQRIFDINVRSVIFLSQAAAAHMGQGGRIINISSIVARLGSPTSTVYAASKAALEGITRVMGVCIYLLSLTLPFIIFYTRIKIIFSFLCRLNSERGGFASTQSRLDP